MGAVMGWQMLVAFACGCLLGGAATIIVYSGDVTITRGVLDHLAKRHWKGTEANLTA
jgi:hypothetical protein